MHVAGRSYLATGIALVGASAIAIAPVQLQMPNIQVPAVSTAAVQLAAQPNPIALWTQVFASAMDNLGGLGEDVLADPFPVLRQFLKNQIGYVETAAGAGKGIVDGLLEYFSPTNPYGLAAGVRDAIEQFKAGDIGTAFTTLASAVITGPIIAGAGLPLLMSGLLEVPVKMAQNFADAVAALLNPTNALPLVTSVLGPILAPISALGASVQDFVEALGAGQIVDAITAVVNVPAVLTGAVLNGFTDGSGNFFGGIFTVGDDPFRAGLLQTLFVTIPRAIATALGAEPEAAPSSTALDEVASPIAEPAATVTVALTESDSPATETEQTADADGVTDPSESAGEPNDGIVSQKPVDEPAVDLAEETVAEPVEEDAAEESVEVTEEETAEDTGGNDGSQGGDEDTADTPAAAGGSPAESSAGDDNASDSSDN